MIRRFSASRSGRRRRGTALRPLSLEHLESRSLLTVFTVTSLTDTVEEDGEVTLREALQAANTNTEVNEAPAGSHRDRIDFDPALFEAGPATITLGGSQLQVVSNVVIRGPSAEGLTIDGAERSQVLGVAAGASVKVKDLTIRGGSTRFARVGRTVVHWVDAQPNIKGGGIHNAGDLSLVNVVVTGNDAMWGGGIHNSGQLRLYRATVSGNSATSGGGISSHGSHLVILDSELTENVAIHQSGGAIYAEGTSANLRHVQLVMNEARTGGAVWTEATDNPWEITRCTFTGNRAHRRVVGAPGAGRIHSTGVVLQISGSSFVRNQTDGSGGAIRIAGTSGVSTIRDSEFTANTAGHGGAIQSAKAAWKIYTSNFQKNSATRNGGAFGGNATGTLARVTVTNNSAGGVGGGVYLYRGRWHVVATTFAENSAATGGGVYLAGGKWMMAASTLWGNLAEDDGGGIASEQGTDANLANSTLSGNFASRHGGGIYVAGPQTWRLTNVTVTNNRADRDHDGFGRGGGIFVDPDVTQFTLHNTIVAGNHVAQLAYDLEGSFDPESSGNLIGRIGTASSLIDGERDNQVGSGSNVRDARLAPLADNGGHTLTHAPLAGSPAIDAGRNEPAEDETNGRDQRDARRIADGDFDGTAIVDVGADERTHRDRIGVFRDQAYYLNSDGLRNSSADTTYRMGRPGSAPLVGDFNGDGLDEIAGHFRRTFFLDENGNGEWDGVAGGDAKYMFGKLGSTPLAGDFNGDGVDEIAAYHGGHFYIDANGNGTWDGRSGGDWNLRFGPFEATPVVGDWDGDGVDQIGVHVGQRFHLDANANGRWDGQAGGDLNYAFGSPDDTPFAGDFNADGIDEIGVHRNHKFFVDYNGNGAWDTEAGGDQLLVFDDLGAPVVGNWRPSGIEYLRPYNGDAKPLPLHDIVILPPMIDFPDVQYL